MNNSSIEILVGEYGIVAGEASSHVARMLTSPAMSRRSYLRRLKSMANEMLEYAERAEQLLQELE